MTSLKNEGLRVPDLRLESLLPEHLMRRRTQPLEYVPDHKTIIPCATSPKNHGEVRIDVERRGILLYQEHKLQNGYGRIDASGQGTHCWVLA